MSDPIEGGGVRYRQWRNRAMEGGAGVAVTGLFYGTINGPILIPPYQTMSDAHLVTWKAQQTSGVARNVNFYAIIDGVAFVGTQNMLDSTWYYIYISDDTPGTLVFDAAAAHLVLDMEPVYGHNVNIYYMQNTGVNFNIETRARLLSL